jgi:hypothetical protein
MKLRIAVSIVLASLLCGSIVQAQGTVIKKSDENSLPVGGPQVFAIDKSWAKLFPNGVYQTGGFVQRNNDPELIYGDEGTDGPEPDFIMPMDFGALGSVGREAEKSSRSGPAIILAFRDGIPAMMTEEFRTKADSGCFQLLEQIASTIKQNWVIPASCDKLKASASFEIGSDGKVSNLRIEKLSGSESMDQSVTKAILSAPAYKLPLKPGARLTFHVTFSTEAILVEAIVPTAKSTPHPHP